MAVLDKMGDACPCAPAVVHHPRVEPRIRGRPVHGDHVHPRKLPTAQIPLPVGRRNNNHSVNAPAQHEAGLLLLHFCLLVRCGNKHRVAVLRGNSRHRVRTGGEERIVKLGKDKRDGI
jgi:hypothetical protein